MAEREPFNPFPALPPIRTPGPPADYVPPVHSAAAQSAAVETPPAVAMPQLDQAERPAAVERQQPIRLAGTVERNPTLTKTPKGRPLAIFPLAVAGEGETVEQHSILAFDERAQKARANVKRGQEVEVIGYPHPREVTQRDGTTSTMSEVYAARVIRASDRKVLV